MHRACKRKNILHTINTGCTKKLGNHASSSLTLPLSRNPEPFVLLCQIGEKLRVGFSLVLQMMMGRGLIPSSQHLSLDYPRLQVPDDSDLQIHAPSAIE